VNILRNLFGTLTSGIIRLLVTVGVLAAAYFFIVKPVLHTTENAVDSANRSFEKSFGASGLDGLGKTFESVDREVQRQIRRSFNTAKHNGNPKRLVRCIQRARGDVHRIQRCTVKF
jgi:hypothetical protein